jgi:hypothetical protein
VASVDCFELGFDFVWENALPSVGNAVSQYGAGIVVAL